MDGWIDVDNLKTPDAFGTALGCRCLVALCAPWLRSCCKINKVAFGLIQWRIMFLYEVPTLWGREGREGFNSTQQLSLDRPEMINFPVCGQSSFSLHVAKVPCIQPTNVGLGTRLWQYLAYDLSSHYLELRCCVPYYGTMNHGLKNNTEVVFTWAGSCEFHMSWSCEILQDCFSVTWIRSRAKKESHDLAHIWSCCHYMFTSMEHL